MAYLCKVSKCITQFTNKVRLIFMLEMRPRRPTKPTPPRPARNMISQLANLQMPPRAQPTQRYAECSCLESYLTVPGYPYPKTSGRTPSKARRATEIQIFRFSTSQDYGNPSHKYVQVDAAESCRQLSFRERQRFPFPFPVAASSIASEASPTRFKLIDCKQPSVR